jgi:SpoVK/Ycf46/Vps4 family AAA+-type ATPase
MPTSWNQQPQKSMNQNTDEPSPSKPAKKGFSWLERMETFIAEDPIRSMDDLIVSSTVRNRIETTLNRLRFHHVLYNEWNLKKIDPHGNRVAINLFGLPGTGKSFCAEAIAHYLQRKIIKINYAEIESKYVGETPKNITAAFKKAKETKAVLFFDEADSILGKRLTNVTQSADHGVNVSRSTMLLELDKFDGVVIFATNLAGNYDQAFVRRILSHIEFELPDRESRIKLWEYLLVTEIPRDNNVIPEWLADVSDGLAGGDILNVVIASASCAVERIGEERKVLQTDILAEINHVRTSKSKIGARSQSNRKVSVTEMPIEELPPDARERYDRIASDSSN